MAVFIYFIAILLSADLQQRVNFWYLFGTMIGGLFYFSGLQIKETNSFHPFCIYTYLSIVFVQALMTGYQYIFEPEIFYLATNMESNGLFQQVNIISISMATACLLAITTVTLSQFSLRSKNLENIRVSVISLFIFITALTIIVLQSAIAWLSFTVCAFVFLCLFYKKNKPRVTLVYIIILLAIVPGIYIIDLPPPTINHNGISQFHLNQMLRFSIQLFLESPYVSWGSNISIGDNYELTRIPFLNTDYYIVPHPYNELLLWVMKSNLINLIFMSLMLTGGFYILFQAIVKYKHNSYGFSLAVIISMLPMIIHNHIQYPFLLSVTHWGIVILFLSFSDIAYLLNEQMAFNINTSISIIISLFILIIGVSVFCFGLLFFNGENSFYTHKSNSDSSKQLTPINLFNVRKTMNVTANQ
ncbi:O-antigen ligase family protein [Morganella psychrotolerans]|uniref:O-antigen ligase family protein n=1 Tax=Morganella psychrotolerans TaxID=368603 RepID=UPI0039AEC319